MELNLTEVDHHVVEWLSRLPVARAVVADCPDGNPVISGTNIPIDVIAALARGQTVAEIIEDYPDLTPEQIDAAVEYAKVYPKTGRPLPTRSFKRMLDEMAESGVWDVEDDDEPLTPRQIP
jgi:uncharacterized protein (DUF433 family)